MLATETGLDGMESLGKYSIQGVSLTQSSPPIALNQYRRLDVVKSKKLFISS
jgi:hypothetical protein